MSDPEILTFIGFHGTNAALWSKIQSFGLKVSRGAEHDKWLGEGVYFFIERNIGLPPQKLAEKWALAEAFDGKGKSRKYLEGMVLKMEAEVERYGVMDLCDQRQLQNFNMFRSTFLERSKGISKPIFDGAVLRALFRTQKYKVIISHQYFQFTEERILKHFSKIHNCTVMCFINIDDDYLHFENLEIEHTFAVL